MFLTATLLPLMLQAGLDPTRGGVPDYSADIQDRPPRELSIIDAPQPTSWLAQCLDQLEDEPTRAHVQAQIRRDTTNGEDRVLANHCLGLASTELGRWEEARAAFTAARQETPAEETRLRARFGAMAGNAALVTGDLPGALALLDAARADALAAQAGGMPGLIALDSARVLVGLEQLDAAEAALAEARMFQPDDAETRLLSATLLRRMGSSPMHKSKSKRQRGSIRQRLRSGWRLELLQFWMAAKRPREAVGNRSLICRREPSSQQARRAISINWGRPNND